MTNDEKARRRQLPAQWFASEDVTGLARALLGKVLCSTLEGIYCSGLIVETEAYRGPEDQASHAFQNRRTKRTEVMYMRGGTAYIYLCYGIHHLFNVVTGPEGVPHAVLIRALEPLENMQAMLERRQLQKAVRRLTGGPGLLSMAMGFHKKYSGLDMTGASSQIWIEDRGNVIQADHILETPRVGVAYAGEYAKRPWRFRKKDSKWTSPAKT